MCCGLVNSCEVHKVYLVSDLYLRAVTDMQYASEYCTLCPPTRLRLFESAICHVPKVSRNTGNDQTLHDQRCHFDALQ
jgi:hypothetical protein